MLGDDLIHETIRLGLLRRHDEITLHISLNFFHRLARVVREPVECAPCLLRECPIDHRCMTRVDVSDVVEAAHALVSIERR